jgi:hypothetical protein
VRRITLVLIASGLLLAAFLPTAGDAVAHSRTEWCITSVTYARGPSIHSRSCSVRDTFTQGSVDEPASGGIARGSYTYP